MSVAAADVVGGWQLEAYLAVDDEGATADGPLGPRPEGLLLYSADGCVSVSMMSSRRAHEPVTFMGYAGRWSLDGDTIVHDVAVSSHAHMVATRQVREVALSGDLLVLGGVALVEGQTRRRLLRWRRVPESFQ